MNTFQRAADFIRNNGLRGITVRLKADGSVPATLAPAGEGFDFGNTWLLQYLAQEVRLGNFQDVMKRKGYASIYLTDSYAASVLHMRVLPCGSVHYLD